MRYPRVDRENAIAVPAFAASDHDAWWRRAMVAGLAASVVSALLVLLASWLFF